MSQILDISHIAPTLKPRVVLSVLAGLLIVIVSKWCICQGMIYLLAVGDTLLFYHRIAPYMFMKSLAHRIGPLVTADKVPDWVSSCLPSQHWKHANITAIPSSCAILPSNVRVTVSRCQGLKQSHALLSRCKLVIERDRNAAIAILQQDIQAI